MNLEDFKSFRRVLIPSEVGSIPTHSRQILAAAALSGAFLLAGTSTAPAQEGPRWEGPSAVGRAARSVVFPAWGQLTNGKNRKATILFSLEAYLYTRIVMETRRGRADQRELQRLEEMGASAAEVAVVEAAAQDHFDRRRDLFFWVVVATFYGAIDAYIDAHLGDFEKELEDGRTLFGHLSVADPSIELGMRF